MNRRPGYELEPEPTWWHVPPDQEDPLAWSLAVREVAELCGEEVAPPVRTEPSLARLLRIQRWVDLGANPWQIPHPPALERVHD